MDVCLSRWAALSRSVLGADQGHSGHTLTCLSQHPDVWSGLSANSGLWGASYSLYPTSTRLRCNTTKQMFYWGVLCVVSVLIPQTDLGLSCQQGDEKCKFQTAASFLTVGLKQNMGQTGYIYNFVCFTLLHFKGRCPVSWFVLVKNTVLTKYQLISIHSIHCATESRDGYRLCN